MATFDERARDWDTPERIDRAARVAAAIEEAIPLRPGDRLVDVGAGTGLIGLADLDTEDGTFHTADAEGIHHLGFDRSDLTELAEGAGFVDVATRTAMVIDEGADDGGYPVFLLTGRGRSISLPGSRDSPTPGR